METETRTRNVTRLAPRSSETARLLWRLYVGLTALQVATLHGLHLPGLAPRMTQDHAVAHALTTISTAGVSPRAESLGAVSPADQGVTIPSVALGATGFVLVYFVLAGDHRRLVESDEFRFYVAVLGLFAVAVAWCCSSGAAPRLAARDDASRALPGRLHRDDGLREHGLRPLVVGR